MTGATTSSTNRLRKGLASAVRQTDHLVGRASGRRRVLVEARAPKNVAILRPVYERLAVDPRIEVRITAEPRPGLDEVFRAAGLASRVIARRTASWMRFDLYMNADPWDAVALHRCARRINFFHGVAGKYDLDDPSGLPVRFDAYDRIAFANVDRMRRYLAAGIIARHQAALIGYPKVDALVNGVYDVAAIRTRLGLDPQRPTALYGPTFSVASSLHVAGEEIIRGLRDNGFNVIVKLHDRSRFPHDKYTNGIDWPARLRPLMHPGRSVLTDDPDSSPYLAASDVLVTDHSSIGFEYCLLDRPLIVFDAPNLPTAARINPEKVALLRTAARVVGTPLELAAAASEAMREPGALSLERRRLAAEMFYQPGTATDRAVAVMYELLDLPLPSPVMAAHLKARET